MKSQFRSLAKDLQAALSTRGPRIMGPGPTACPPWVLEAMQADFGHMNPQFLAACDLGHEALRGIFGVPNYQVVYAGTGNGSEGIETMISNLIPPDGKMIVLNHGEFGRRAALMAAAMDLEPIAIECPWHEELDLEVVRSAVKANNGAVAIFLVRAETGNGRHINCPEIARIVREEAPEMLILVDDVTGLGGIPLDAEANGYDAVSSGSQKCLNVPTGLHPQCYSPRAVEVIRSRDWKVGSWKRDVAEVVKYFGQTGDSSQGRIYHTTAATNLLRGLWASCAALLEEGLDEVYRRHHETAGLFRVGLRAMGLELPVPDESALDTVIQFRVPVPAKDLVAACRKEFGIEFATGLGPWAADTIRIGNMGQAAQYQNVASCCEAIHGGLTGLQVKVPPLFEVVHSIEKAASAV